MLQYAISHDMIDLSSMQQKVEMKKREYYLSLHPNNIWQGKNGKWYTHLDDSNRTLKKKNSKEEIEDSVCEFYKNLEEEPTLKEVYLDWIDCKLKSTEICQGTYDRYENDYKRFFVGSDIENRKIRSIMDDELEMFIKESIVKNELSQKGYAGLRTLVLGIFKHAKKKKCTDISISYFMKDLELPKKIFNKKIKNKEDQVYLEDEIVKATEYLKSNPTIENLGLLLTFQTGIRVGELAALKYSDRNNHNRLRIQRMEIKYKDEISRTCVHEIVEFTKSDAGYRNLYLTDSAIETLEIAHKKNPFGEYLFEKDRKRILTGTYNDALSRMCKAIGIKTKSMHKIRRSYGTTLIDNDCDDSVVMEQMGHADITTTRKFYYYSNKNSETKMEQIRKAVSI